MRAFLVAFCSCITISGHAQVFQAGDLITSLGYGSYRGNLNQSDTAGYNMGWGLFGDQFPIRIEFGLADRLSVNLSYTYTSWGDRYFRRFEKNNWIDVGAGVSYHVPWESKRMDFAGEMEFGYSQYHVENYDSSSFSSIAQGIFVRGGISPSIYFTKAQRLGALAYYRFSYYFLGGSEYDGVNPRWEYDLSGFSHSYGVGLFYRFGKPRTSSYLNETKSH